MSTISSITSAVGVPYFSVMRALDVAIAGLRLPSSIQVGYTGEYRQLIDTGARMLWVLLGSVVLVYGIIALQLLPVIYVATDRWRRSPGLAPRESAPSSV